MSDPAMIKEIMAAVSIPVMAKSRIGHLVEAQILQEIGVDYIDESEVLTPADPALHVDKHPYRVPFVCGCKNLGKWLPSLLRTFVLVLVRARADDDWVAGEALRRVNEGAAMIRTKGEAGTGNVIEAVRHARQVRSEIALTRNMSDEELADYAKEISVPVELLRGVRETGRLPVVMFSAGGIATPADAALMMQLGMDGVFVGSGIFKSSDPAALAKAIVLATTHYDDAKVLAEVSTGLGPGMKGEGNLGGPGKEMTADRGY